MASFTSSAYATPVLAYRTQKASFNRWRAGRGERLWTEWKPEESFIPPLTGTCSFLHFLCLAVIPGNSNSSFHSATQPLSHSATQPLSHSATLSILLYRLVYKNGKDGSVKHYKPCACSHKCDSGHPSLFSNCSFLCVAIFV